jgi:hypothetical protein
VARFPQEYGGNRPKTPVRSPQALNANRGRGPVPASDLREVLAAGQAARAVGGAEPGGGAGAVAFSRARLRCSAARACITE